MDYANSRKQVVKIEKNERRLRGVVITWLMFMFIAQGFVIYQLWTVAQRNEDYLSEIKQFAKCLVLVADRDNPDQAKLIDQCIEDSGTADRPKDDGGSSSSGSSAGQGNSGQPAATNSPRPTVKQPSSPQKSPRDNPEPKPTTSAERPPRAIDPPGPIGSIPVCLPFSNVCVRR